MIFIDSIREIMWYKKQLLHNHIRLKQIQVTYSNGVKRTVITEVLWLLNPPYAMGILHTCVNISTHKLVDTVFHA